MPFQGGWRGLTGEQTAGHTARPGEAPIVGLARIKWGGRPKAVKTGWPDSRSPCATNCTTREHAVALEPATFLNGGREGHEAMKP